jgi:excinuclease UvrABC nuclease subunit
MAPAEDLDTIRRAALALRKARQLRPELSARLIHWPIEHRSYAVADLTNDWAAVPQQPGVYLFRDDSGYLYIGEAKELQARLQTHLQGSDRAALAHALQRPTLDGIHVDLHIFPTDSPGATLGVRRAYESELIRSRQPRLNLRP